MTLKTGKSKKGIGENIKKEIHATSKAHKKIHKKKIMTDGGYMMA